MKNNITKNRFPEDKKIIAYNKEPSELYNKNIPFDVIKTFPEIDVKVLFAQATVNDFPAMVPVMVEEVIWDFMSNNLSESGKYAILNIGNSKEKIFPSVATKITDITDLFSSDSAVYFYERDWMLWLKVYIPHLNKKNIWNWQYDLYTEIVIKPINE